jgi:cytoplasmic iron level regulating protein YaaA (DUF328/UPF0246 family)
MLALLSPAKKLHAPDFAGIQITQPALLADTELLMERTRGLSRTRLRSLMGISEKLADLNYERFQAFSTPFDADNAHPAALAFAGDTYLGLEAWTLPEADLHFGQDCLGILSGLYGLLRPLDLMQPYRLEMGTSLKNQRGKNLYDFWRQSVTREICERLESHRDKRVINLASKEYFQAVDTDRLPGPVVTPVFRENKDGKSRTIGFMAKKARGSMARYILTQRLEEAEGLKDFTEGDYAYQPQISDESTWVFTRKQPPPVGA